MKALHLAPQPLSRHPGFVASSPDELRDVYSRATTPIVIEPIGRARRSEVSVHQAAFGPLRLHSFSFASLGALRGSTPHNGDVYVFSVPRAGALESRIGGRVVPMEVGRFASLVSPGDAVEVVAHPGHLGVELVIPRAVLHAAFVALTGQQPRKLRLAPSFPLTTPRGAAALRLLHLIEQELEHDVLRDVPSITARLADSLVHALLVAQSDVADAPPAGPVCVRLVEEYIEANLAEPLTLSDLGAVSGVSVRALQVAFRAHRGLSPLQFLRDRRLERARAALASGDDVRVTEVALAFGFEHLGRFSVRYRERFGESPADTLRRARG